MLARAKPLPWLGVVLAAIALTAGAEQGMGKATGTKPRVKRTLVVLPLPAPRKTGEARKRVRVHRGLSAREWRRRRVRRVRVYWRVRRSDDRWSRRVPVGPKVVLADEDGRRRVEAALGFAYNPRRGLVRYALRVKNVGVPKRRYKQLRLLAEMTVRYRF